MRTSARVLATPARPSYATPFQRTPCTPRNPGTKVPCECCSLIARSLPSGWPLRAGPVGSSRARKQKEKGSGTLAGALVSMSAPCGRGARSAERARLSAFHRGTCCSERTPQLSSRYALPGTRRHQVLPASSLSQSSDFTRRPVIVPAGRNTPEPPGSGGDEPPSAGTALAPPARSHRPASFYEGVIRGMYPKRRRNVNIIVTPGSLRVDGGNYDRLRSLGILVEK
jgi:hypothetical protein